jgi:cephalosporin hydroxylase
MSFFARLLKAIGSPDRILPFFKRTIIDYSIKINNAFIESKNIKEPPPSGLKELDEVRKRSITRSDINDHLVTLFLESLSLNPKLIVELGVRGGETAFVLERVAKICDSMLVCVDLEDCSDVCKSPNSSFIRSDDIEFAPKFKAWCEERGIEPYIDVLHIDTSHLFDHTMQEIEHWFPLLSKRSKAFFHDTNLKRVFKRKDGSMGWGWDNERGVIRALEAYFKKRFDEEEDFIDFVDGWLIKHSSFCNGFTTLERILARD